MHTWVVHYEFDDVVAIGVAVFDDVSADGCVVVDGCAQTVELKPGIGIVSSKSDKRFCSSDKR